MPALSIPTRTFMLPQRPVKRVQEDRSPPLSGGKTSNPLKSVYYKCRFLLNLTFSKFTTGFAVSEPVSADWTSAFTPPDTSPTYHPYRTDSSASSLKSQSQRGFLQIFYNNIHSSSNIVYLLGCRIVWQNQTGQTVSRDCLRCILRRLIIYRYKYAITKLSFH